MTRVWRIIYSPAEMQWLADNRTMVISDYHRAFCAAFGRSDVQAVHLHALRKRQGWKVGRAPAAKHLAAAGGAAMTEHRAGCPSGDFGPCDCARPPLRVQRQRTKGWRMPPNTVSVSRPGKWGNPFICGPAYESENCSLPEVTPAIAVHAYRSYLERSLANHASTREALDTLRGKNLACWCRLDAPCHADVLLELANR